MVINNDNLFLNPVIRGFGCLNIYLANNFWLKVPAKTGVNSFASLAICHLLVTASWSYTRIYSGTIPAFTEFTGILPFLFFLGSR